MIFFVTSSSMCTFAQIDESILSTNIKTDAAVKELYEWLKKSKFADYSEKFKQQLKKHDWDDWIYYKIVDKSINSYFADRSDDFKTVFCWYVMNESGFDSRLVYSRDNLLMFVYTADRLAGVSQYINDGKNFACLNAIDIFDKRGFIESKIFLNENGRSFSFALTKPPKLPPIDSSSYDTFYHELGFIDSLGFHRLIVFKVKINHVLISMMKSYPILPYEKAFNAPISDELYNSFIPQLKELAKTMDTVEIANFIFHFVRDGFLYPDNNDPGPNSKAKLATPEE
ncbi:MAG: hypothetical protein ACKO96_24940, partial [Flammeovirgaceae bacterium]